MFSPNVKALPMAKSKQERLVEVMAAAKVSKSQLGREIGVTSTSIMRYFNQLDDDTIDEDVWRQIVDALKTHGIEAEQIRPVQIPSTVDVSLVSHLDAFTEPEQLRALISILTGNKGAQDTVRVLAADRLKRRQ